MTWERGTDGSNEEAEEMIPRAEMDMPTWCQHRDAHVIRSTRPAFKILCLDNESLGDSRDPVYIFFIKPLYIVWMKKC